MWIKFDKDGLLLELKIYNYIKNDENRYVKLSFNYKFKEIINYKKEDQEILLCKDIDNLKKMLYDFLNDKLTDKYKPTETLYCYEPDFYFEFIGDRWLTINTYLWNNENRKGQITNNMISTTLEKEQVRQLYLYLKLQLNEIDMNNKEIVEMLNCGIIYE